MIYQSSFSVAGVNTANSILNNLKAAASDRAKLLEFAISIVTAPTTAPEFSLERMNAVGTGTITTQAIEKADSADGTASLTLEVGWATTRPTRLATPAPFRRFQLPLALGSAFVLDFTNSPLIIGLSGGIMLNQITASGATLGQYDGWWKWDE
jgi:hypothetical protein